MDKKYELTDEKIEAFDTTLYRIRALRDIPAFDIKAGDLGGFIEREENLSHDGDAWVTGNAEVCGGARVSGDARVYENADIMWLSKIGSRLGTTTVFKAKDGNIKVTCGCFYGSLDEFDKQVEKTHGDNRYGKEYKAFIELVKIHFKEK